MATQKETIKDLKELANFYPLEDIAYELGVSSFTVKKWLRDKKCPHWHHFAIKELLLTFLETDKYYDDV